MSSAKGTPRRRERVAVRPPVGSGVAIAPGPAAGAMGLWWRLGAIVLVGVLTYANSLSNPFIFDDNLAVVENTQIRDVWNLGHALSPPANTALAGRPLVNLSFAINYAVGGLDVRGYHAVNMALHLICGLLVFGLVRRSLEVFGGHTVAGRRSFDLAFAVALLWTVHPLNSEVVDYLTERTESLMAVCYLATLYASTRALRSPRHGVWNATAVLSCAAGMACKESMVTAPLMVMLYDRVFEFGSFKQALRIRGAFYAGLATTWLLLAALVASHGQTSSAGFATAHVSRWTYLLNQTVMLTRYFRLAVWPRSLVLWYGWARPLTVRDVWPYALFIALLLIVTIVAVARRPRLGFIGAWVFITLAPTSSLVPVATEVGAERRMYLPLVGLVTLAVIGAALVSHRLWRRVPEGHVAPRGWRVLQVLVFVLVSAALGAETLARNREYASPLTLARTVLGRWPTPNAEELVGGELAAVGQHEEAILHLREAVRGYPPAHFDLGSELFAVGHLDEAIAQLQAFVVVEPDLEATRRAQILLGRAFETKERWPQAIEQFRLVLRRIPDDSEAHGLLAKALGGQRAFDEAIPHYRAFLSVNANDAGAWTGLGIALAATGRVSEAVGAFRNAVRADPHGGHSLENLARALVDHGEVDEAAGWARQAAALDPNDPAAHEILGRVFASQGKFDDARRELERSLQLDPSYTPAIEDLRRLRVKSPLVPSRAR